jgi:hypothetical protein
MQKGLDTYKKVSGWMIWSFGIALILSAAEFIIGFFAIFSRWGSLVTTIVSTVRSHPYSPSTTHSTLIDSHRLNPSSSSLPQSPQPPSTVSSSASSSPCSSPTISRRLLANRCCLSSGSLSPSAWHPVSSGYSAYAAAAASRRTRRSASRRHPTPTSVSPVPLSPRSSMDIRHMLEVQDTHRQAQRMSHSGRRAPKYLALFRDDREEEGDMGNR